MHMHKGIHRIENATTRPLTAILAQRQSHRIATLGHNQIIHDFHRTNYLTTGRAERVTRVLPKPKKSWLRRVLSLFTN
jgi:hypothetical protein